MADRLVHIRPGREREGSSIRLHQLRIDRRHIIKITVRWGTLARWRSISMFPMQGAGQLEKRFVAPGIHGKIRDRDDKADVVAPVGLVPVDTVETRRKRAPGLAVTEHLKAEG